MKKMPFIFILAAIVAHGQPAFAQYSQKTYSAMRLHNGLPPCKLDSFIYSAGHKAEAIYGDEGCNGLPPINGFTTANRINSGIFGTTDAGLTTGHGSYLPDAWGADEFLTPPGEWSQSGACGGDHKYNHAADALDAASLATSASSSGRSNSVNQPPYAPPNSDYQPIYQHGVFVGYMSPELSSRMNVDPAGAWTAFANSTDFTGSRGMQLSILRETGAITPEQQQEMNNLMLGL